MSVLESADRRPAGRIPVWLVVLLFSLLGIVMILIYSRFGAGLGGDATRYILGARNMLAGNGYSYFSGGGELVPISSFPPFFPIVLAGLGLSGMDLFELARFLNAFLFGATLFLSGSLIYRYTRSVAAVWIGCGFVVSTSTLIELYGWSWSEPLFIILMLSMIFATLQYLEREKFWILLVIALLGGMATVTRYVGIGLVGSIALSLLLFSKASWRRRLAHALLLGVTGVLPLGLWFWRNARVAGTLANRSLIFHPMRGELLRQYVEEIASWLIPMQFDLPRIRHRLLLAAGFFLIAVVLIYLSRRHAAGEVWTTNEREFRSLPWVISINITAYLIVLILNSTFLDAGTTPGAVPRYFAPIFILVVILLACTIQQLLQGARVRSFASAALILMAGILFGVYVFQSIELLRDPRLKLGYVTARMFWAQEVEALNELDPAATLVTSNPELTYVLSGRASYMIPISFNPNNLEPRDDFEQQIAAAREQLSQDGVLVIYGYGELDDNSSKVVEQLGVEPLQLLTNAKLYVLP